MGPKKQPGGGGAKAKADSKSEIEKLTAVERAFYELQIGDLKTKIEFYEDFRVQVEAEVQRLEDVKEFFNKPVKDEEDEIVRVQIEVDNLVLKKIMLQKELTERHDTIQRNADENREAIRKLQMQHEEMYKQLTADAKIKEAELFAIKDFIAIENEIVRRIFKFKDDQEEEMKKFAEEADFFHNKKLEFERKLKKETYITVKRMAMDLRRKDKGKDKLRMAEETSELDSILFRLGWQGEKMKTRLRKSSELGKKLISETKYKKANRLVKLDIYLAKIKTVQKLKKRNRAIESSCPNYSKFMEAYTHYNNERKCVREHRALAERQALDMYEQHRLLDLELHEKEHSLHDVNEDIVLMKRFFKATNERILDSMGFLQSPEIPSKLDKIAGQKYQERWTYLVHDLMDLLSFYMGSYEEGIKTLGLQQQESQIEFDRRLQMRDLTIATSEPICELFSRKHLFTLRGSSESSEIGFKPKRHEDVIIPSEREHDSQVLIDVVKGSSLYVSSPRGSQAEVAAEDGGGPVEEEPEEEDADSGSSSSTSVVQKKDSAVKLSVEKVEPGVDGDPVPVEVAKQDIGQGDAVSAESLIIDVDAVAPESGEENEGSEEDEKERQSGGYSIRKSPRHHDNRDDDPDDYSEESYRLLFF